MFFWWGLGNVKLSPEAEEFVPGRLSQPIQRRDRPWSDHDRNWGRQDVPYRNEQRQYYENAAIPPHGTSRHDLRGARGRGRGGRGGNHSFDISTHCPRFARLKNNNDHSRQHRGSNCPPAHNFPDGEYHQKHIVGTDMRENLPETKEALLQKSKKGNGDARKPLTKEKATNETDSYLTTDVLAEHVEVENNPRAHKEWRGTGRLANPRKIGPAIHPSSQGNWRERAPQHSDKVSKDRREDKPRRSKDEPNWRCGTGREKRAHIHEKGNGKAGGAEKRTGPIKRVEPPKSKETQTSKTK